MREDDERMTTGNQPVRMPARERHPVYVIGEVKRPGNYPYADGMSVVVAVALAGGFTHRARKDAFYIDRPSGGRTKRLAAETATQLFPGDVITVRERGST